MKLASFKINETGAETIGAFVDGAYVDLVALTDGALPNRMIDFLEGGEANLKKAKDALAGDTGKASYKPEQITLRSPVPRPGKIMHTSCNFDAHLSELTTWQDVEWQSHNWGDFHFEHPTGFLEAPSCVVGSGEGVRCPHFSKQLDYEVEIGIIIGKKAFRVSTDEALDYIAGLTIFNDLSARDIQAREHSNKVILLGKSFDGSCPLGPHLVTLDELPDLNDMGLYTYVNGEERQNAKTSGLHYKFAELVSWWSNTTLEPGDVITTGSPPGVIAGMENPKWLQPGDVVECKVDGLGTLTTPIIE